MGERDSRKNSQERLLSSRPQLAHSVMSGRIAEHRRGLAPHEPDRPFDGGNDLKDGHLVGRSGKTATTLGPALGLDNPGMAQVSEDGLKKFGGQISLHRNPLGGHRPMGGKASQFDNGSHGIFGSCTDLHPVSLSAPSARVGTLAKHRCSSSPNQSVPRFPIDIVGFQHYH